MKRGMPVGADIGQDSSMTKAHRESVERMMGKEFCESLLRKLRLFVAIVGCWAVKLFRRVSKSLVENGQHIDFCVSSHSTTHNEV